MKYTNIIQYAEFLLKTQLLPVTGLRKRYPRLLELTVTHECNGRCVMCGVWKFHDKPEWTVQEFRRYLHDPVFKKIKTVCINGGEPSLLWLLPDFAGIVLQLPSVRSMTVISNGFLTERLLADARIIYHECRRKNVTFHVSVSLDGVGSVHDTVRGVPGAFEKTARTLRELADHRSLYCDSFSAVCTVVRANVYHLPQLRAWAAEHGVPVKYTPGLPDRRIGSDALLDQFSVFGDPAARQAASEFFYSQFLEERDVSARFRYYSLYAGLTGGTRPNRRGCPWKEMGITLDPGGNVYYCAAESDRLGCLKEKTGTAVFFSPGNLVKRNAVVRTKCPDCFYEYEGNAGMREKIRFLLYLLKTARSADVCAEK